MNKQFEYEMFAGLIDLEEPENVYPEDDYGAQNDLEVDSYIEDQAFEN